MPMNRSFRVLLIMICLIGGVAAQGLSGTLAAADTGAAIPFATVLAIQQGVPATQRPLIYETRTDAEGRYSITAQAGQYRFCIQASGFVDPCLWGGARSVSTATATTLTLQAQRGRMLLLRVHDGVGLLTRAETVPGNAISAFISSASVGGMPLPMVYEDAQVRDYGLLAPLNVPLTVNVSSTFVALRDAVGAGLSPQGIRLQVRQAAAVSTDPAQITFARKFPPPDATMVHVFAKALVQ